MKKNIVIALLALVLIASIALAAGPHFTAAIADFTSYITIAGGAQLATSNQTGTAGAIVMSNAPTIASPVLTGTPTAPSASAGTNTTQIATTHFVTGTANNIPLANLTGETDGLCVVGSAGVWVAGSCASGTPTVQLLAVNSNTSSTTTNGTSLIALHSYTFSAGQINGLGKQFHIKAPLTAFGPGSGAIPENVSYGISLGGASAVVATYQATTTGVTVEADLLCQVTTAGATGVIACYVDERIKDGSSTYAVRAAGGSFSSVDLTSTVTIDEVFAYQSSAVGQSASSSAWPVWQDN